MIKNIFNFHFCAVCEISKLKINIEAWLKLSLIDNFIINSNMENLIMLLLEL